MKYTKKIQMPYGTRLFSDAPVDLQKAVGLTLTICGGNVFGESPWLAPYMYNARFDMEPESVSLYNIVLKGPNGIHGQLVTTQPISVGRKLQAAHPTTKEDMARLNDELKPTYTVVGFWEVISCVERPEREKVVNIRTHGGGIYVHLDDDANMGIYMPTTSIWDQ